MVSGNDDRDTIRTGDSAAASFLLFCAFAGDAPDRTSTAARATATTLTNVTPLRVGRRLRDREACCGSPRSLVQCALRRRRSSRLARTVRQLRALRPPVCREPAPVRPIAAPL